MRNLKYWFTEHFWTTENTREDMVRDNLIRSGISLRSLNERLDGYLPQSADRLPELIGQYADINDIIMSSINRFKREHTQKPWGREERRDKLRDYLSKSIADYISTRPEAFKRVVQKNMPLPSYA